MTFIVKNQRYEDVGGTALWRVRHVLHFTALVFSFHFLTSPYHPLPLTPHPSPQLMVERSLLAGRSWQSIKERFRKVGRRLILVMFIPGRMLIHPQISLFLLFIP